MGERLKVRFWIPLTLKTTFVPKTEGQKAGALKAHVSDYDVDARLTARAPANWFRRRSRVVCTRLKQRPRGAEGAHDRLQPPARNEQHERPGRRSKYRTKGVTYCPHCDGPLFKGKRVAVIGGGNLAWKRSLSIWRELLNTLPCWSSP